MTIDLYEEEKQVMYICRSSIKGKYNFMGSCAQASDSGQVKFRMFNDKNIFSYLSLCVVDFLLLFL